jgi:hypothetical protein
VLVRYAVRWRRNDMMEVHGVGNAISPSSWLFV